MFCIKTQNLRPMKNNIRVERAIKNLTQEDLANKVSVSRQTINAMEANKYVPSTVLALKIAKVFNKSVEDIFFLEKGD
jgi:putative transcriptional regulator